MSDRLIWNDAVVAAIGRQDYLRRALASYGEALATVATAGAPRAAKHHSPPSGHGADTIHAETVTESGGWTARVSWDAAHAYMRFPERREHFLRRAAERYGRTAG